MTHPPLHGSKYATHKLGLFSGKRAYDSARIEGAITTAFDPKIGKVEAIPLPVEAVKTLERILKAGYPIEEPIQAFMK